MTHPCNLKKAEIKQHRILKLFSSSSMQIMGGQEILLHEELFHAYLCSWSSFIMF